MLKRRLTVLIIPIALLSSLLVHNSEDPVQSSSKSELLAMLDSQLTESGIDSLNIAHTNRKMTKLRGKIHKLIQNETNPHDFLSGLADIKKSKVGLKYEHNYKINELRKAKSRWKSLDKSGHSATIAWVERGPGNISGRARAVVVDPSDPNHDTWFVASVGGGIWKTTDAGATWSNKTPELSTLSTVTLAIAASNNDVMYIGTGMGYGRLVDLSGSGVWTSVDHGETWTQLASTANGELLGAINRLVIDPNNPNIVILCSNNSFTYEDPNGGNRKSGIFRTTDDGTTWTQTFDPDDVLGTATDNRVQQVIANPQNFNTLYATVNEVGVLKSIDGGISWAVSVDTLALPEDIGVPVVGYGPGISTRIEVAIAPTDTNRIYAAVERPRGIADLYMSQDGGTTWNLVHDTGDDPNWFSNSGLSGSLTYTAGWFNNTIAVSPYDKNAVFVGGINQYRLDVDDSNNRRSSTRISSNRYEVAPNLYSHSDHHWLEIIPVHEATNTFTILSCNDGGLSISDDSGQNWRQLSGMGTTQFYSADKKPGADVYIGGLQDNGVQMSTSSDPDANSVWGPQTRGDGIEVAWHATDPDMILSTTQGGFLYRTTDGGIIWDYATEGIAGYGPFLSKIGYSKTDPDLVFTIGSDGVKRSDDFGATWSLTTISGNWMGWRPFDNVEVSEANPQVVWISSCLTYDSRQNTIGGIHVSSDGGFSFTEISSNFPDYLSESSGIGTHPTDDSTAYFLFSAPGSPKILRTTDLGNSWVDISGFSTPGEPSTKGFPDVACFCLIVMPYDENTIWVGTEIGVFISEDAGTSWNYQEAGLPHVGVFQMKIVDDQVVAATQGRGVWSVTLDELAAYVRPQVTLVPRVTELYQLPGGDITLTIDLRGNYDSTQVLMNEQLYVVLAFNATRTDTSFVIVPEDNQALTFRALSYKNERVYTSGTKTIKPFLDAPANNFATMFSEPEDVNLFYGDDYAVATLSQFDDPALHTEHPYPPARDLIAYLTQPLLLAGTADTLSYWDIALVEEGMVEDHTDPYFWDFVIVEGTVNGEDWIPLAPGYDCRFDPVWYNAYLNNLPATESMYREHRIGLLDTFEAGDVVNIRFRLFSDPALTGWGWVIDNILYNRERLGTDPLSGLPAKLSLMQNYPNPFNASTMIDYALPRDERAALVIYDITGREVIRLFDEHKTAGPGTIEWQGTDSRGVSAGSGLYFMQLRSGDEVIGRKIILLK
ncbi:T9SS type A sorting domain-containing protein [Candidatus Neomarinimicrobiota bacterium]